MSGGPRVVLLFIVNVPVFVGCRDNYLSFHSITPYEKYKSAGE
eukprot:COSAG02_NODE_67005_length_254_cov_0.645161_1_plen_42_part_10